VTQTWRATEKAQRRAQYLREAARLFAIKGFHAVSIDELGAAVGVSGPALYRHFSSKEGMLSELLVGASERLLEGFRAIAAQQQPDFQTLHSLVTFHLDFALAERDVIRIQDRELANLPAEVNRRVRRLQREYVTGWSAIVGRLRPGTSAADLEVIMHAVFGILNSTPHSARLDGLADVRGILGAAALRTLLGGTETLTGPAQNTVAGAAALPTP
jgi:AcrR family transcriptional regulator